MLRMIKVDFRATKCYWKYITIIPISVICVSIMTPTMALPLSIFFFFLVSTYPFSVEEKGKLDNLYLTLPVSRRTIVKTRFVLSLLMMAAAYVFGLLVTLIMTKLMNEPNFFVGSLYFAMDFKMYCLLIAISFLLYAFLNLSMFPVLFKLGYTKGKIIGLYIPTIIIFSFIYVVMLSFYLSDKAITLGLNALSWANNHIALVILLIFSAGGLLLAASYALSLKSYRKREL